MVRKSSDGIHRRDVEIGCNLVSCVPLFFFLTVLKEFIFKLKDLQCFDYAK